MIQNCSSLKLYLIFMSINCNIQGGAKTNIGVLKDPDVYHSFISESSVWSYEQRFSQLATNLSSLTALLDWK